METTLSKDVQEKLDMINWDSLKDKYGISRDTFYNNLRGRGMYGVPFSEEQVKGLIEGNAVIHSGLRKDGESFSCCVQFDAAKREPVISHPS